MSRIKDSYLNLSIFVSFIVGFWMFYKKLISGYPGFFIGNENAINGLNNINSLWSNLNFGEPHIQNSWLVVFSKIYNLVRYLHIDPFLINSAICFFCLLASYIYVKRIINTQYARHDVYVFLIATAYSFSTFSLIFFEQNTFFVYLYWLVPLKLHIVHNLRESKKNSLFNILLIVLFASVNLPFGIFVEFLSIVYLLLSKELPLKEYTKYIALSIVALFIAVLPALFYTFLNISYTNSVLASEMFYRQNTSVTSFINGITGWDFFGQYNGYLYREYSDIFTNFFGKLSSFLFLVPVIVIILNKDRKFRNIIIVSLLLLISSIVIGEKYEITGLIYSAFDHLPMSEIFRNNSKFFFVIDSLILMLIIFNKEIRIAGIVWFIASLPIIFLFASGLVLQSYTTNHNISSDYEKVSQNRLIRDTDSIVLFPTQYMPHYKGESSRDVKSVGAYSWPEFFFNSNIVVNRCVGCGNPVLESDIKTLTDITDNNWFNKIREYGITKLIYDRNVSILYYPETLSEDEFESILNTKQVTYGKDIQNSVVIYSLDSSVQNDVTACDPLWFQHSNFALTRECSQGQKYFYRSAESIFLPNVFMYAQIILLALLALFIY